MHKMHSIPNDRFGLCCLYSLSGVQELRSHVWHRSETVARRKWCLVVVRSSQGGLNMYIPVFIPVLPTLFCCYLTVQSKSCNDLPAGSCYNVPLITTLVIILNSEVNLTPTLSPAFTSCGLFSCFVRQHLIKAETSLLPFSASWTEKILWG